MDRKRDGTTAIKVSERELSSIGHETKLREFQDGMLARERESSCQGLTCTIVKFETNGSGALVERQRDITTYFGGVQGLIEREEKIQAGKRKIVQALYDESDQFAGYVISGKDRATFWGRDGLIDFKVEGSCHLTSPTRLRCTLKKATSVDLAVTDEQDYEYLVISEGSRSHIVSYELRYKSTIMNRGSTSEHLLSAIRLDESLRVSIREVDLLGNGTSVWTTYEYNGPDGSLSKAIRYKADSEIEYTEEYPYARSF